jgi:hypothetical protein
VISVTDPYGRILGFLDRSRYFLRYILNGNALYVSSILRNTNATEVRFG